ncbi:unnamed protein product [Mytilus edulis]|uniref:Methyltransferase domain-containing protein n=1 Tax=Mytilus edulis TaxID=6550 RepID=A0A8S3VCU6_MYTED|nr:unnamed protein product [Mytilus edulis]
MATHNRYWTVNHGNDMGRGRKKDARQVTVDGVVSGLRCKWTRGGLNTAKRGGGCYATIESITIMENIKRWLPREMARRPCLSLFTLICVITAALLAAIYFPIEFGNKKDETASTSNLFVIKNDVTGAKLNEVRKYPLKGDKHCLATVESYLDNKGQFIIPSEELYGSTLQTYCPMHGRHGSVKDGWTFCQSGCYTPNANTMIYAISSVNDAVNEKSAKLKLNSNVERFSIKQNTGWTLSKQLVVSKKGQWINRCTRCRDSSKKMDDTHLTIPDESTLNSYDNATITDLYTRYLTSLQIHCTQVIRPGILKDGGWNVCHDVKYRPPVNCLVYDFWGTEDVLIIDAGALTKQILTTVLKSAVLEKFQQVLIRTNYRSGGSIDYKAALRHYRSIYEEGFRLFWSREEWGYARGLLTGCLYLHFMHKDCRDSSKKMDDTHLTIPDEYLTSLQIHCTQVIRPGILKDGGWNVCHDVKYRPPVNCLVYDFGIGNDFVFDDDITKIYGCEVHGFDPTMKMKSRRRSEKAWFHDVGIGEVEYTRRNKFKMSTFQNISKALGHENRKMDIIKMDIEKSEWVSMPVMIKQGYFKDVKQFLIEFHAYPAVSYLLQLKSLYDIGFRIFWYHRNPFWKNLFVHNDTQHSACYEVHMMKVDV